MKRKSDDAFASLIETEVEKDWWRLFPLVNDRKIASVGVVFIRGRKHGDRKFRLR